MKIQDKIKNYFKKRPQGNIWQRAFWYFVLIRYVGPMFLMLSLFMVLGLAAPEVDPTETIQNVADAISEIIVRAGTTVFNMGANIAKNNPILSKVLIYGIGHLVWIFYLGFAIMILDALRHIISWILNKEKLSNVEKIHSIVDDAMEGKISEKKCLSRVRRILG